MPASDSAISLDSFVTFGDLLKYLRRRARLTQREVAIAVGYSEAQISRLEQNQRPPDLATLTAQFIPALYLEDEPEIVARLLDLAAQARGEEQPKGGVITFSSSVRREIKESVRMEEEIRSNIPIALNSFVGREHEISEIKNLLQTSRLVTLLGAGGSGKTRLALQVASQLTNSYEDGTWLIELAPISNPAHVPQAFIAALNMPEPRDGSYAGTIKKFLRGKQVLLVVDNCEHIIIEAASLLREILSHCPHVQIIATSREVLDLPGEARYPVPTLEIQTEAVTLFADRAKSKLRNFELTEENASRVAHICERLDGLPLAIELAASRLSALSLDEIASLLDNRFDLLTLGHRTDLPRQQTLRAAVDWSYNLLSEEEQKSFRRLAVFAGGFDMSAAGTVLGDSAHALNAIPRFVDKSLIVADQPPESAMRFRMLESIREYSLEKLRESGEAEQIRAAHFDHFLSFAREANLKLRGRDQVEWMKRFEREHENLRAALRFASEGESPALAQSGLRLVHLLIYFWFLKGYQADRKEWIERYLNLPHQPRNTAEYARTISIRAHWQNDPSVALPMFEDSLSIAKNLKDESALAAIHFSRAAFGWLEDDPAQGRFHFEKCIELYRKLENRWQLARKLSEFGEFAQVRLNERTQTRTLMEESLQIMRELEDQRGMAFALVRLGDLLIEQNKLDDAKQFCSEGLALAAELNDMETMAWGINDLGVISMCEGNLEEAERMCAESLALSRDWGAEWHIIIRRYWLARVVMQKGEDERAAELFEDNRLEAITAGFDWGQAASLQGLGDIALRRGELTQARSLHTDGMRILHTGHYGYSLAYSLDSFAALAMAENQPECASILLSAADAYRESIQTDLLPPEQKDREKLLAAVKAALPPEKILLLIAQGQGMNHDEAVEFALS